MSENIKIALLYIQLCSNLQSAHTGGCVFRHETIGQFDCPMEKKNENFAYTSIPPYIFMA
jgi:hypothetical protein